MGDLGRRISKASSESRALCDDESGERGSGSGCGSGAKREERIFKTLCRQKALGRTSFCTKCVAVTPFFFYFPTTTNTNTKTVFKSS